MFDWLAKLNANDWAIVFATLMGPILAVQAQKSLEGFRAYRDQSSTSSAC